METLKDLKCHDCRKWLDSNTTTCCESGLRICGKCYEEIKSRSKCPACRMDIDDDDDDHFQVDFIARKKVKRVEAPCKSCGVQMLLATLRGHQEVCWSAEEAEHASEVQEEDDRVVDVKQDEGIENMQHDQVQEPIQHVPVPIPVPIQSCQYRPFGCLFQGTSHELMQHKSTCRPPLKCSVAKVLQSCIEIVQNQHSEYATKWQEIKEMHQLLTAAAYPET